MITEHTNKDRRKCDGYHPIKARKMASRDTTDKRDFSLLVEPPHSREDQGTLREKIKKMSSFSVEKEFI